MTETLTVVNKLTPERQKLLQCLESNVYDSITDLCKDAGVTRNVYYDAVNSPEFVTELFKTSTGSIYAAIPQIMNKIIKQAKSGSSVHQSMLFSMVKLYQGDKPNINIDNRTVNVNVTYEQAEPEMIKELEKHGWKVAR